MSPPQAKLTILVHARVTENYPFSSKEKVGNLLDKAGTTLVRLLPSLDLNDVRKKTLLKEAKQNARSNEFFLSSERAPNSKRNRCAVYRHLRENGADCTIYRHEGGRRRKRFLFHKRLLMTLVICVPINVKFQWETLKTKQKT